MHVINPHDEANTALNHDKALPFSVAIKTFEFFFLRKAGLVCLEHSVVFLFLSSRLFRTEEFPSHRTDMSVFGTMNMSHNSIGVSNKHSITKGATAHCTHPAKINSTVTSLTNPKTPPISSIKV